MIDTTTKPSFENCIKPDFTNALIPITEPAQDLVTVETRSLQTKSPPKGRFQKGVSGNPKGRPKGSRNRLTDQVLKKIAEDFSIHGQEVLERVRDEEPATYLKMVISLLPRELVMQFEQHRPSEVGQLDSHEMVELAECDQTQQLAETVYKNEPPKVRGRR